MRQRPPHHYFASKLARVESQAKVSHAPSAQLRESVMMIQSDGSGTLSFRSRGCPRGDLTVAPAAVRQYSGAQRGCSSCFPRIFESVKSMARPSAGRYMDTVSAGLAAIQANHADALH